MNPMSDRMRDVASTSNVRVSKAVLYSNNMPVMELPISEGSVTVDSEAAVRRSMTAKIVGREDLVPARAADLLFPNVNEVKLYTGFQYSPADPKRYLTADEEFVSQGIFRIDKPEIDYSDGSVTISLTGMDRSTRAQGNRLDAPYVVPAGRSYSDEIARLILHVDPRADLDFTDIPYRTPQIILDIGADGWEEAQKMATAVGADLSYNTEGRIGLYPEPDASVNPVVWEYIQGEKNMAVELKKTLDGSYGYNKVVIRGFSSTGEEGPVLAEAWDDDPTSPTFVGDPPGTSDYGLVTYFASSIFISTKAQAQAYANSTLLRVLGAGETISCTSLVLPGQDAGDVVHVQWDPLQINGRMVITSLTMPLDEGSDMSFETKRRQVL